MNLTDIVTAVLAPLRANFSVHTLDNAATVVAETGEEITVRTTGPQQFSWARQGGPCLATPFAAGTALDAEAALRQWATGFEPANA